MSRQNDWTHTECCEKAQGPLLKTILKNVQRKWKKKVWLLENKILKTEERLWIFAQMRPRWAQLKQHNIHTTVCTSALGEEKRSIFGLTVFLEDRKKSYKWAKLADVTNHKPVPVVHSLKRLSSLMLKNKINKLNK